MKTSVLNVFRRQIQNRKPQSAIRTSVNLSDEVVRFRLWKIKEVFNKFVQQAQSKEEIKKEQVEKVQNFIKN